MKMSPRSAARYRVLGCRPWLAVEQLEDRLAPAVIQWDGGPTGIGTDFNTAANWVGDVVPGPSDDAVIGPAFTGQVIATNTDTNLLSLTTAAPFTISSTSRVLRKTLACQGLR